MKQTVQLKVLDERAAFVDVGSEKMHVSIAGGPPEVFGTMTVEHAERQWLPERHAAAIKAMIARWGLTMGRLKRFVAGADVFSRESDGETIAGQYKRLGVYFKPANTSRINGWAEILTRLGDKDPGIPPRLFIHERCRRLVDTMPALQHDPSRPEDVLKVDSDEDGRGGDDAADALRYLVATKRYEPGAAVGW